MLRRLLPLGLLPPLLCLALSLAGCTWSFPGSPSGGDAAEASDSTAGAMGSEQIPLTELPPAEPPASTAAPEPGPSPSATPTADGSPRLEDPATMADAATLAPLLTAEPTAPLAVVVTPTPAPTSAATEVTATVTLTITAEPAVVAAAAEPTATPLPLTHVVAAGETLYRIGEQYGLSWVAIAELNGISNPDQITAGQELRLPQPTPVAEPAAVTQAPSAQETVETPAQAETVEAAAAMETPAPRPETHTVAPGDSLYRISQLYGVSWVEIAEANGLTTANQIYIGQVLKIPVSRPGPTPSFTHQVRAGETVFRIALQYGVPLAVLAEANGLQPPYVIYPGQQLAIPTGDGE